MPNASTMPISLLHFICSYDFATALDDRRPQIDGNRVVWYGYDETDTGIYFYDGDVITQLTDNNIPDYNPQISGGNIVWARKISCSDDHVCFSVWSLYAAVWVFNAGVGRAMQRYELPHCIDAVLRHLRQSLIVWAGQPQDGPPKTYDGGLCLRNIASLTFCGYGPVGQFRQCVPTACLRSALTRWLIVSDVQGELFCRGGTVACRHRLDRFCGGRWSKHSPPSQRLFGGARPR